MGPKEGQQEEEQIGRGALFAGAAAGARLLPIRDASLPRVLEPVLDEDGEQELEPALDKDKDPVIDETTGEPKMKLKFARRHPPKMFPDGQPRHVEIRRPSVSERAAILRHAKAHKGADKLELDQLQTEGIIRLTYWPGTQRRVFTAADRAAMLNQPTGGWVDEYSEVVMSFLNVDEKELEKNSARTPTGKPSSR